MVNLTIHELKLIAGKRGVKNYKSMSREKLLSTLDESEHDFKNYHKLNLRELQKCIIFYK